MMTSETQAASRFTHDEMASLLRLAGTRSAYLADIDVFEDNILAFLRAFRSRYPRTEVGYSYKTNYLPDFIRVAAKHGARTEVVSRMELQYAESLGLAGPGTLFNGPVKSHDDLTHAFTCGATVVIDSLSEIHDVIAAAERASIENPAKVAVRCQLPKSTPGTRFGVDLRTSEARRGLAAIHATDALDLVGLHAHHSGDRSAERYALRVRELIDLHLDVLGGQPLEFLDIGGGFGSPLPPDLIDQLGSDNPSFDTYAESVTGHLLDAYGQEGPTLIAEPGMGLLAETTTFVTQVMRTKLQNADAVAVVDGSLFNVKPLRSGVNLPGHVVSDLDTGTQGTWRFVGHTCMEIDVLRDEHLGRVAEGDFLVMPNLGAYTTVLNAPFISPLPPIIALSREAEARVVRHQLASDHLAKTFGHLS